MKLAMIGSYGHTGFVLQSLPKLKDVKLAAVAKYGPDDPLSFVGKHPAVPKDTPVYDDYERMLDEIRPDIVSVCMPLYRNAEASIAAARHGCHIFSEKPLATSLADLASLRQAVADNGVRIAAMFGTRCEPAFQTVRQAVADGRIGRPILASAQKSYPLGRRDDYYKKRQTYGGSIPWQAIHALEFVSYCTGKDYRRATAMQSNEAAAKYPEMEDNGGILLELSGGGHAVIWFDYLRPKAEAVQRRHGDDRLRIAGSEGIIEVVDEGTRVVLTTPRNVEDVPLAPARDLFGEFIASIGGSGECIVTPAESFGITEVALRARQAADDGAVVDL